MRPTRDQTLMRVAVIIAQRSTCNRLNVGAVVAREGRILTTGYNGPPSGMNHCSHESEAPCDDSVHAEANAIVWAARYGMSTNDCELFVTHSPCVNCAKLIINAGLVRVVYGVEYRDPAGLDLLEAASVETFYSAP